ncbi:hypothetical protein Ahy_A04g018964 [Arachis hypogaea]|uniref:Uncharacterized protein n=1 Tax=Arachis hypogaea TaxID=3818 RepID=A0A445DF17_ARAHY|nr:hypothetical protein Ahy_A04g018964 [Arachis hypogaea]
MNFAEGKSPSIEKQPAGQIFEKFEILARIKEMSGDMKEKCYLCATSVKTYADGSTNNYDPVCTLNAQEPLLLSKIINAMCLILNQQNIQRFEEEIYCLPPNIVRWKILTAKIKKPFIIEDYQMFIPFLDLKKLASHPYIYYCSFHFLSIQ